MDDQAFDDGMAVQDRSLDADFETGEEALNGDDYSVHNRGIGEEDLIDDDFYSINDRAMEDAEDLVGGEDDYSVHNRDIEVEDLAGDGDDYSIHDRDLEVAPNDAIDSELAVADDQMINNRDLFRRRRKYKSAEMIRLEALKKNSKKSLKRQEKAEKADRKAEKARRKMDRYREEMNYEKARASEKRSRAQSQIQQVENAKVLDKEEDDDDEAGGFGGGGEPEDRSMQDPQSALEPAISALALPKKKPPVLPVKAVQSRNLSPVGPSAKGGSSFLSIGLFLLIGLVGAVITIGGVMYYYDLPLYHLVNYDAKRGEEDAEAAQTEPQSQNSNSSRTEEMVEIPLMNQASVATEAAQA